MDFDVCYLLMLVFGEFMIDMEIVVLVDYVQVLFDVLIDSVGVILFVDNCVFCYGDVGIGDCMIGVLNLVDVIWLYGGDIVSLIDIIINVCFGVMLVWGQCLLEEDVCVVVIYVYVLGGGEQFFLGWVCFWGCLIFMLVNQWVIGQFVFFWNWCYFCVLVLVVDRLCGIM